MTSAIKVKQDACGSGAGPANLIRYITAVTGTETKKQPATPTLHLRLEPSKLKLGKYFRGIAFVTLLFAAIGTSMRG
jgi:hypothetical protein